MTEGVVTSRSGLEGKCFGMWVVGIFEVLSPEIWMGGANSKKL